MIHSIQIYLTWINTLDISFILYEKQEMEAQVEQYHKGATKQILMVGYSTRQLIWPLQ